MKVTERTKEHLLHIIKALQAKVSDLHQLHFEQTKTAEILRRSEQQYKRIFDALGEAIHIVDRELRILIFNKRFEEWLQELGMQTEAVGHSIFEVFPFLPAGIAEEYKKVFENGEVLVTEEKNRISSREIITRTRKIPLWENGKVTRVITVIEDITARRKADQDLKYYLQFEKLITQLAAKFINILPHEIDSAINTALAEIAKFAEVDRSYIFLASENRATVSNIQEWCREGVESQLNKLKNIPVDAYPWLAEKLMNLETVYVPRVVDLPLEAEAIKKEWLSEDVQSVVMVPLVSKGEAVGFLGLDSVLQERTFSQEIIALLKVSAEIFINAIERKNLEIKLRQSQEEKVTILNSMAEHVLYYEDSMRIIWANKAAAESVGLSVEELIGRYCYEVWHQRKEPCSNCPVMRARQTGQVEKEEVVTPDGRVWFIRGYPIRGEQGKVRGVVEVTLEVTKEKLAEREKEKLNRELLKSNRKLSQLALRDYQTGLYNHRYLEEVVESEFHRARRYAHPLAVIMLDIDYFKSINEIYGYQLGDLVLKQLARQLKMMVRRYDIVGRFGGEEFIIISPGSDSSIALKLAQRILNMVDSYNFGNKKYSLKLKLSIAVTSYPEDKVIRGIDLITLAEKILHKVKEAGGNNVFFSKDLRFKKTFLLGEEEESSNVKMLKSRINKLTQEANQSVIESILAFARTIELKDHYTGEHVEKTVRFATGIARTLGMSKEEINRIRQAAVLHDLGKIGISEKILRKPSSLTRKEFEVIKTHPQIGVDIIRPIHSLSDIIPFIYYHHERWDGRGYPFGLKGEEIPLGARIIAVADVYQALISDRPYRKAYSKDEALEIIRSGAGTQFDPEIVNKFITLLEEE